MSNKQEVSTLIKQAAALVKKQAENTKSYLDVSELKKLASKTKDKK